MISGTGVHMYKGVFVWGEGGFALLILSNFFKYPMNMKKFGLTGFLTLQLLIVP